MATRHDCPHPCHIPTPPPSISPISVLRTAKRKKTWSRTKILCHKNYCLEIWAHKRWRQLWSDGCGVERRPKGLAPPLYVCTLLRRVKCNKCEGGGGGSDLTTIKWLSRKLRRSVSQEGGRWGVGERGYRKCVSSPREPANGTMLDNNVNISRVVKGC